ncbi:MAG: hypothetical protein GY820_02490 [Gammaproteobacteria bacterium]|nr:hypothetical protein [Gammaproteobacteria bacterium]
MPSCSKIEQDATLFEKANSEQRFLEQDDTLFEVGTFPGSIHGGTVRRIGCVENVVVGFRASFHIIIIIMGFSTVQNVHVHP